MPSDNTNLAQLKVYSTINLLTETNPTPNMPPTYTHMKLSSVEFVLTSKDSFVCVKFTATNAEHHVTERAAIKQCAEIIAQPAVRNFDRCTTRLTRYVHRFPHYAHLIAPSVFWVFATCCRRKRTRPFLLGSYLMWVFELLLADLLLNNKT